MGQDQPRERSGFRVYGRVQGVGFRWWTSRIANRLGLVGSVRNLPDGSVEVRAQGPPAALGELARQLRDGPRTAVVRRVDPFPIGVLSSETFEIER